MKEKNLLDTLKDYTPLISGILLILGAIRLIFFYKFFGVDITSYIDLSEIIILSISFLLTSSAILLFAATIAALAVSSDIGANEVSEGKSEQELTDIRNDRIKKSSYATILYICTFGVMGIIAFGPSSQRVTSDLFLVYIPIILLVPPLIPVWHNLLNKAYLKIFNAEINGRYLFSAVLVIIVVLNTIVYARLVARRVIYDDDVSATMFYNGKYIKTTNNYKFIGKTKNYIFFYNDSTGYTKTFPLSDIKEFSLKDSDAHKRVVSSSSKKHSPSKLSKPVPQ